jgi:hypothetical protein
MTVQSWNFVQTTTKYTQMAWKIIPNPFSLSVYSPNPVLCEHRCLHTCISLLSHGWFTTHSLDRKSQQVIECEGQKLSSTQGGLKFFSSLAHNVFFPLAHRVVMLEVQTEERALIKHLSPPLNTSRVKRRQKMRNRPILGIRVNNIPFLYRSQTWKD